MRLCTSLSHKVRGLLTLPASIAYNTGSSSFHTSLVQQKKVLGPWQGLRIASKQSHSKSIKTLIHFPGQKALSTVTCPWLFYNKKPYRSLVRTSNTSYEGSSGEVWNLLCRNMSQSTSNSDKQTFRCQDTKLQTKKVATDIFNHAVNSVLPHQMIKKNLFYDAVSSKMQVASHEYHLRQNVRVIGFGKAVLGMARALEDCVGNHVVDGVLSIPMGAQDALEKAGRREMLLLPQSKIRVMEGAADNLPDEASHHAASEIAHVVESMGTDDILIVLISGGGSALLPAPEPPLTLVDTLTVTQVLARSGVNIQELNMVRKQLDRLKGGGIARLAHPGQVISLILSDIIGDDLSFIASGPTVPNTSTPQNCLDLFSRYGVEASIPTSVMSYLKSKVSTSDGFIEEDLSHVQNVLIGTNKIACESACSKSSASGFLSYMLSTELSGEAKFVGEMFAAIAQYSVESFHHTEGSHPATAASGAYSRDTHSTASSIRERLLTEFCLRESSLDDIHTLVQEAKQSESVQGICIIAGGETTVAVKGNGRGGRNQEMAIAAGIELYSLFHENKDQISQKHSMQPNETSGPSKLSNNRNISVDKLPVQDVVFLSAGTDGQDGPTTAAGGVVDLDFVFQAKEADLNVFEYLAENDSFTLLSKLDSSSNLVITGLTGTNVMDLQILIVQFCHL